MKKHAKQYIAQRLEDQGVLPMFGHTDWKISVKLLEALHAGGVRVVEFTNRSSDALAVFRKIKRQVAENLPDLILGVGTIMKKREAKWFIREKADFVVAPIIDKQVANYCKHKGIFWCPGASTLNEMIMAHRLGADLIKAFPIEQLGGPSYIKAIKAPCPWLPIMPTGGIAPDEKGLRPWFEAGIRVVGIGSKLFTAEITSSGQFDLLAKRTQEMLHAVVWIRKNLTKNIDHDKQ
jgi:2-dehydro-3-deoxyphosphogluconate aldolase / (4S)-4-hydroxy-2-oxoglutarate aldolase